MRYTSHPHWTWGNCEKCIRRKRQRFISLVLMLEEDNEHDLGFHHHHDHHDDHHHHHHDHHHHDYHHHHHNHHPHHVHIILLMIITPNTIIIWYIVIVIATIIFNNIFILINFNIPFIDNMTTVSNIVVVLLLYLLSLSQAMIGVGVLPWGLSDIYLSGQFLSNVKYLRCLMSSNTG